MSNENSKEPQGSINSSHEQSHEKVKPVKPVKEESKQEVKKKNVGRWSEEEHDLFLEALRIHGKDWFAIEKHVGTRDAGHCRAHA